MSEFSIPRGTSQSDEISFKTDGDFIEIDVTIDLIGNYAYQTFPLSIEQAKGLIDFLTEKINNANTSAQTDKDKI